jgi:hypothetical protein
MTDAFEHATEQLYDLLNGSIPEAQQATIEARDEVLKRYGDLFTPERAAEIKEHEFASFLHHRNNKHWSGLDRATPMLTADMDALREALSVLVDASEPLDERYTQAIRRIKGLGKATATAILQVAHPDSCAVWNATSEHGLKALDLWPSFERGLSAGEKYARVNDVLVRLADAVDTDLWTLDTLWALLDEDSQPSSNYRSTGDGSSLGVSEPSADVTPGTETGDVARFGLERYLQEFLRDNWTQTRLGAEWTLYEEEGDPEAGFEYPVSVGYIDLLARHKTDDRWLVIELKRGQTGDQTVGQVLRYMGAVRRELAEDGDTVEGLIIAHGSNDKLRYAAAEVPSIDLKLYDVEFHLRPDTPTA